MSDRPMPLPYVAHVLGLSVDYVRQLVDAKPCVADAPLAGESPASVPTAHACRCVAARIGLIVDGDLFAVVGDYAELRHGEMGY
jgi:hypothetical protein